MIEEIFRVVVDVPETVDMDSKEFDTLFHYAVEGSIESGTQDHDWRYIYAIFTSYHEAVICESKLIVALS